jgi:phospholipase/carboxylesterase
MLTYRERPADGDPEGLLILHHGRGADENDLYPLADLFDPRRRLHVVTPRAPERAGLPGYHWYRVLRVGYPDPDTFAESCALLAELHDHLLASTGTSADRMVLGGFSMGTVMSYALGLGRDRPAPAGIVAFSGFIPTVEGWAPNTADRASLGVFIAHGRLDPVIDVAFAHRARELLTESGLDVEYHESDVAHHIDPRTLPLATEFVASRVLRR